MNSYRHALRLAALGFHAFPLIADAKLPQIDDFPNRATTDEVTLRRWFFDDVMDLPQPYNVGISMGRCGDGWLFALDVDNKGEKNGTAELLKLEMQGFDLPETYTQYTPSGGEHRVFFAPHAVRNGVDVLGRGLDIRGYGGFIVGSGSTIGGKAYADNGKPVAPAPQWLIDRCGKPIERKQLSAEPPAHVDQDRAREQVIRYLSTEAPESIKGSGGDHTAYKVAARVKDLGVSEEDALDLMMEHWFEGSGWSRDRLAEKVAHAYRYGKAPVGAASPDVQFKPVESATTADPFVRRLAATSLVDIGVTGGADYIVKSVLDRGGSSLWWGAPGQGKTTVLYALALHVAAGLSWCGHRTRKAPVILFALEGGAGSHRRLAALRQEYGIADAPLFLCTEPLAFRAAADVEAICAMVRSIADRCGQPVGLVIVDSWNRALQGDENASRDVGELLAAFAAIQALGPHLAAIHHPRKSGDAERGHGSARADTDATIEIADGRIIFHKVRDAAKGDPIRFATKVVTLGTDDEGDAITAPVALFGAAAEFSGGGTEPGIDAAVRKLCDYLSGRKLTPRELETKHLARIGLTATMLRKAISVGTGRGQIVQIKDGRRRPLTASTEGEE